MAGKKRKGKALPNAKGKAAKATDGPASKKRKFDFFNFTTNEVDPIIENLREVSTRYKHDKNLGEEVLEQVALEGLTGITFGHLCRLLDASIGNLDSIQNDQTQDYIWSIVVKLYMKRISGASIQAFYLNPELKPSPTKSTDKGKGSQESQVTSESSGRSQQLVIDKQIKLPSHTLKRIAKTDWMLHPVQDGHVMGSCAHYLSRLNISQEILDLFEESGPRGSLHELNRKYDLKNIFLVADQEMRQKMLLPSNYDPNMDLKLREYACLELIGRTRCLGIVFPNDKSLGRYRILLTAKELITQFQQTCNSYIVHHIKKFSQFNLEVEGKAFKGGLLPVVSRIPSNGATVGEDEVADTNEGTPTIKGTCCNLRRLKIDCDILRIVYDVIALSKGRSMLNICSKLRLPKSHVRNHLKNLVNIGMIGSHTRLIGDKMTRIYRAKRMSNRRKLARKRMLKGVRARWDDIDLRAKEMLGHRRSHFSKAEDSLLILCRITCLLMEPNLKKLSFCVPKHVIRDTLHDELFESHDKTADSLLRRTKFLRHLQENKMRINELIAELREDHDIMRLAQSREGVKSNEKLAKLFRQLLRAVRAKLPHLLGLTSGLITNSDRAISIKSRADLSAKFELVDCQMPLDALMSNSMKPSGSSARAADSADGSDGTQLTPSAPAGQKAAMSASAKRTSSRPVSHQQPTSLLIQLAHPIDGDVQLDVSECKGMKSILSLASFCAASCFNLNLELKVPVRVVGLDQDNEGFKEIFERAKESKETSRIIADLTSPNPTADSRRAIFMLRNALKLQTLEKCGKLIDALVVQPCDIRFRSDEKIVFSERHLLDEFSKSVTKEGEGKATTKMEITSPRPQTRSGLHEMLPARQEEPVASTSSGAQSAAAPAMESEELAAKSADNLKQILKEIETLLSWISAYPGMELDTLKVKTMHFLMGGNDDGVHLQALLHLMERLGLIQCEHFNPADINDGEVQEPRLFGYYTKHLEATSSRRTTRGRGSRRARATTQGDERREARVVITYEPTPNAYLKYCQLINVEL